MESETGEHEGLYLEIKHFKTDVDPVMAYKTLNGMGGRKWLKGVTLDIELRYTHSVISFRLGHNIFLSREALENVKKGRGRNN